MCRPRTTHMPIASPRPFSALPNLPVHRSWSRFDRCLMWPGYGRFGPNWDESRCLTKFGCRFRSGYDLARVRPNSAESGRHLVWTKIGSVWLNCSNIGPNLAQFWEIWSKSVKVGLKSANTSQRRTKYGLNSAAVVQAVGEGHMETSALEWPSPSRISV